MAFSKLSKTTVGAARNGAMASVLAIALWAPTIVQYKFLQLAWDGNRLAGQRDIVQQNYDQAFNGLPYGVPLPPYQSDLPIGNIVFLVIFAMLAVALTIVAGMCFGVAIGSGNEDLNVGSRIATFVRKVRGRFTSSAPHSEESVHEKVQ